MKKEIEGKGEMKKSIEDKIIDFVKKNKNLDDSKFHGFVEKMGIDPHEAEEVIYRKLNTVLTNKKTQELLKNKKLQELRLVIRKLIKESL